MIGATGQEGAGLRLVWTGRQGRGHVPGRGETGLGGVLIGAAGRQGRGYTVWAGPGRCGGKERGSWGGIGAPGRAGAGAEEAGSLAGLESAPPAAPARRRGRFLRPPAELERAGPAMETALVYHEAMTAARLLWDE